MDEARTEDPQPISDEQVQAVLDLYERGLYLQAYRASLPWGPLTVWRGTGATVLAGRLASNLGAVRLSHWLMRCAWRRDPADGEARYYYAYTLWQLRGPYFAGRWIAPRADLPDDTSADVRASWDALRGGIAGMLRDFHAAEGFLRRAEQTAPDSPWVQVCWSGLLEWEDKYEEALQAAQRALTLQPWFRPGVQAAAHVLTLLDRDDQALRLLTDAVQHIESHTLLAQLYQLQIELQRYAEARDSLERHAELSPLAEKNLQQWLAAQRSEVAYRLDDWDGAIRYAADSGSEFFKTIAARLQEPARAAAPVRMLPVGFVRQHHLTCGPATLAAISRYWSMPADHLQVADEICYNGTSYYHERKWAEEHGWTAREFTVTEPAAAALIAQGIPFTLATVEPGSAHLQAVIGYDGRRGTLLIRDPYWRNSGEGLVDKVLEHYRAYGPRGLALVPATESAKLEGVELPDAARWDQLHALDAALVAHRPGEAQQIFAQLREAAPEHWLIREARRRLALYDQNPTEHLAAVEGLLALQSEDQSLQLQRLSCLRELARRDERLAIYREQCAKSETHPLFWQQYAQELRSDARRHDDAIWLLRRAIRRWPTEGANYYILAGIYWDQRRFDEALELYRLAACLDDKEEKFAHDYFLASNCRKQTERALTFLRERFERFGRQSSLPARTLYAAYVLVERTPEALAVIEEAMARRPDDGELLLYAADAYLSSSSEHLPRAQALLQQAREKCPPAAWLRTAARMAHREGRLTESLDYWRQSLGRQPLAMDAHRAVTQLLAETQGRAAALDHLAQSSHRFPHYHPLHELWIEWLRDELPEVRDPVLAQILAENPDDAWLRREAALWLSDQRRFGEAWEQLALAAQLEPLSQSYHLVRAHLFRAQDRIDEARQALRQAIELSVDSDLAIAELIQLCERLDQRREVLAFVKDQLVRQVIFGDGLLAFRRHARDALEAAEVLALLRDAWQARPDLWHAWSALVGQLQDMTQLDEAWDLACQATERFPLVPRLWLDRAAVGRARGDNQAEHEAVQTAYQINPDWTATVHRLCDVHERHGQYERSRQVLEQVVVRNPLDLGSQLRLAHAQWRMGEREAALNRAHDVVQRDPGFEYAWELLNTWADELGCPERALQAARELTALRAGEARGWLMLAKLLDAPPQLDERLAALDKVANLNPRSLDAHDLRAVSLAAAERWDEALAACQPAVWNDHPPNLLRARAAWIEAQRGNLQAAIQRMQQLVSDEPFYYEAWSQLADWQQEAENTAGYLEAAQALARIRPHSEVSFGYLAEAKRMTGDRTGAKQALQRACELNPGYEFGGFGLFDMHLEDGELAAAADALGTLRLHTESPFLVAREAQLAAKQGRREDACQTLARVCSLPCESAAPVRVAVTALTDAGWPDAAERVLESKLDDEQAHPAVAAQWGWLRGRRADTRCADRLQQLAARGESGCEATRAYLNALFETGANAVARRFVLAYRGWLRSRTTTWGLGGWALTQLREFRLAAEWHADWRERDDVEPWMLVNAVEGLRVVRREAEAAEASRRALALPPAHGQHLHHLWLAADDVGQGRIVEAQQHLLQARTTPLDKDYEFLATMVESVVEVAQAPREQLAAVFRQVRRRLDVARAQYAAYTLEPARRRVYRRCLPLLARRRGTLGAWLWCALRWLNS